MRTSRKAKEKENAICVRRNETVKWRRTTYPILNPSNKVKMIKNENGTPVQSSPN